MVGAIVGAMVAYVGLAQFLDNLFGTNAMDFLSSALVDAIMTCLKPFTWILTLLYDGALTIVTTFFTS